MSVGPLSTISAGNAAHFQFWYRDPPGGPTGFNLTDALSITFCPYSATNSRTDRITVMKTIHSLLSVLAFFTFSTYANTQNVIWNNSSGNPVSSSTISDIDGDGVREAVLGFPYYQTSFVKILSGSNGNTLATYIAESSWDQFGYSVSGFTDVNLDTFPDILVGANVFDSSKGKVYMLSGVDGSILWSVEGENTNDKFGSSVCLVGDVDADGIDDALVGAPRWDNTALGFSDTGKAYLISGATGSTIQSWHGDGVSDQFGSTVTGTGDLDGDGVEDLAVGAPYDDNLFTNSGSVRAFSGATGDILIFAVNGESTGARFGTCLASIQDINSDGLPDLLVGAPYHSSQNQFECGAAYAISGGDGSIIHRAEGGSSKNGYGHKLGTSISSVGDLSLDGVDDYLVGAEFASIDNNEEGYAIVFSGSTGTGLTNPIWGDWNAYRNQGRSVSGLGDIDADGIPDYLIAANSKIRAYGGDPFLGENYCLTNLNTSGHLAQIGGTGTSSVAANDLNLQVTGAVPNQFGVFYYGIGRTQVAFGYGWRCVGPPFRRLPVIQLDATGNGQHAFDNTPTPEIPQNLKIEVGDTFNFQFWYRDPTAGGPAFNLSDAVEITFYP